MSIVVVFVIGIVLLLGISDVVVLILVVVVVVVVVILVVIVVMSGLWQSFMSPIWESANSGQKSTAPFHPETR